jgi:hypothetical protein
LVAPILNGAVNPHYLKSQAFNSSPLQDLRLDARLELLKTVLPLFSLSVKDIFMERKSILLEPVHPVGVETALERNTDLWAIAALVDVHNFQFHSGFYGHLISSRL